MLRRRIAACCGVLALVPAAGPGRAAAQDGDPQVDPGSPAGTEYQLPIDRAREEAAGGSSGTGAGDGGTSTGAAGAAPLFGEGVEPDDAGDSGSPGSSATKATTTERRTQLGASTTELVRAHADAPEGGGLVAIGAGAAGVLVLGGAAGLLWRRRTMRG